MKQKYKLLEGMNIRSTPDSTSQYNIKTTYAAGVEIIAVDQKTISNGSIWLQIENIGDWICYYGGVSKKYYLELVEDLESSGSEGETNPDEDGGESSQQSACYEKYKVIVTGLIKRTDHFVSVDTDTGERFTNGEIVTIIEKFEDKEGSLWGKVYNGIDPNSKTNIRVIKPSVDPNHPIVIGTIEVLKDTKYYTTEDCTGASFDAHVGEVRNVVRDKFEYEGSYLYQLESELYITASEEFVKFTPLSGDNNTPGSSEAEASAILGYVTVKPGLSVWYRKSPSWSDSAKAGIVYGGTKLAVLEILQSSSMYKFTSDKIPSGYITQNTTYVTFEKVASPDNKPDEGDQPENPSDENVPEPQSDEVSSDGDAPTEEDSKEKVTGALTVINNNGVCLRTKLSWSDDAKSQTVAKKDDKLITVSDKIQVGDGYMYKLDIGLYVTASTNYVTFTSINTFIWGCIYYKPSNETEMVLYTESESDFKEPTMYAYYKVTAKFLKKRFGPSESDGIAGEFAQFEQIQVVDKFIDDMGNVWVKTSEGIWGCYYYADYNEYYMEVLDNSGIAGNMTGTVNATSVVMREDHTPDSTILGNFFKGEKLKIVELYTDDNKSLWVKTSDGIWACAVDNTTSPPCVYISIGAITGSTNADQSVAIDKDTVQSVIQLGGTVGNPRVNNTANSYTTSYDNNTNRTYIVPSERDWHNPRVIEAGSQGGSGRTFPRRAESGGTTVYDYTIETDTSNIKKMLNIIHKEINYQFAYDRSDLGQLYHQQFNRFKIVYPDYMVKQLIPVIFITRPDLNLFNSTSGSSLSPQTQIDNDPVISYLVKSCPQTMSALTTSYIYGSSHNFNPLLSNLCEGVDIIDEYVDVFETGETFTGFKTAYAKSNIKSMTASQLSVKFKETFDLSVTKTMQAWVRYESCVYRGELLPKDIYIYGKVIDYCCNIYYFLLDPDMETIRFWSKYYGAFPINVSKSIFNGDMALATGINTSEVSTTFQYYKKKDFDVTSLVEFNIDSGSLGGKKENLYNDETGLSGRTWVNAPFITTDTISGIGGMKIDRFRLVWKPGQTVEPSVSINR